MKNHEERVLQPSFDEETIEYIERACASFAMQSAHTSELTSKDYDSMKAAFTAGLAFGVVRTCWMFSNFIIQEGQVNTDALLELKALMTEKIIAKEK